MKKLNTVLLIDDDEPTNYFNRMVIEESGLVENIVVLEMAEEALKYLSTEENGKYPKPDLIFLDINMPGMNGWEFLSEYEKLPISQQGKVIVVMLTTSLNPDDFERAKEYEQIEEFFSKPLTIEGVKEIISKNFPEIG